MSTVFDYISVLGFVVIVVLYFHYNNKQEQNFTGYFWPSLGCAFTNYFGNKGYPEVAFILIAITILYIYIFIIRRGGIPDEYDDDA